MKFNIYFETKKMPDEWRKGSLVPIYKKKGIMKVV